MKSGKKGNKKHQLLTHFFVYLFLCLQTWNKLSWLAELQIIELDQDDEYTQKKYNISHLTPKSI